jgi:hypothetical protein
MSQNRDMGHPFFLILHFLISQTRAIRRPVFWFYGFPSLRQKAAQGWGTDSCGREERFLTLWNG